MTIPAGFQIPGFQQPGFQPQQGGLPFRNFSESTSFLDYLVANKATTAECGQGYNYAYRQIVQSYQWASRKNSTIIGTADPYAVGTVTATQGSTNLVGVATAWTSSMTGLFVRVGGDMNYYQVTYVSPTLLTLEHAYVPTTKTASGYELFGLRYSLPVDVSELKFYAQGNTNPLEPRDANYLNFVDPNRLEVDSAPICYVLHGIDSGGNLVVEFWPRPPSALAIRMEYYSRVGDLSASDLPIIRADLVELLSLYYICSQLDVKFGDQHWDRRAKSYYDRYEKVLDEAKQEDESRQNLPDSVEWERPIVRGAAYYALHDVP